MQNNKTRRLNLLVSAKNEMSTTNLKQTEHALTPLLPKDKFSEFQ